MKIVNAPSYPEWFVSEHKFLCDVLLLRHDGQTQIMKDCNFSYSFGDKKPVISKDWYPVLDYFFVKRIINVEVKQ